MRVVAAVAVLVAASPAFAAKPQRIVSLNLCTDQILLDLVSRQRIAALSFLAADPTMSSMVEEARGLKTIQGAAEEVLALDPDLVFVGQYSTPATVSLLERLGQRVVKVAMASSFEEIRSVVRHMAEAVGEGPRGDAMIADFDARISAAKALPDSSPPTVMAMQVNSLASGPGSLLDEVFEVSGFHNMARDAAAKGLLGPGGRMPLETLVLNPPDLLVLANSPDDFRTVLGDNLRHPAFGRVAASRKSVHLPMSLWLCGTPRIAGAVETLVETRARMDRKQGAP